MNIYPIDTLTPTEIGRHRWETRRKTRECIVEAVPSAALRDECQRRRFECRSFEYCARRAVHADTERGVALHLRLMRKSQHRCRRNHVLLVHKAVEANI